MFDRSKGTDCAMQPLGTNDPRRIGDYRLLGVLGAGGMGRVYLGRNAGGRTVAVKVIRPDLVGGNEFRTRFRREVAAAQQVGGRFTAPVLDADVDADPPWLATGYVAGFALSEAVERFGTFSENTLLVLARDLAEALVAVHEAGVVHRDLKPSNVLLAVDGPKVIDFGIARAVEDTALTTTGKVIGSPGFMCPEQVTGEPVGPASDVFALGGVLAFAAAGHGPFGAGETMQMLWRIVYEDPHLDAVPDRLRPLVASCLAKDPATRPTPHRLLDDLAALGVPEHAGWLPPPVLEEMSVRAVRLLDLDSGPVDVPAELSVSPGASAPGGQDLGRPRIADAAPPDPTGQRSYSQWQPARQGPFAAQSAAQPAGATTGSQQAHVRRGPLLAGLLVACVVVAIGAFVIGAQLRGSGGDNGGSGASASAAPITGASSTATGAAVTSVPRAFVGAWRGTAADGLVTFDIELSVREGEVGQEVATSANTGKLSQQRCARNERLTAATENQLTFVARLTADSPADCTDGGSTSTVRLQPDGSLSYSTPGVFGGTIAGTLHRG
ncbi:serine/threonine-protein kinase [Nocardia sp. NPDC050793]|uniref:serine/threonine-protein kinase n=1 Tax=Nocardia sp. NPDC050793 TaxID=3155159 RepID=UPI0033D7586E